MGRGERGRGLTRLGRAACALLFAHPAAAEPSACERAGLAAEAAHGVPAGLLVAIGLVESGRFDPALGRLAPWPWTTNAAGIGRYWQTRADATAAAGPMGAASVDVGCFQVNLRAHPDAFGSVDEAFDPDRNADYAARFLAELRARLGSWEAAVGRYHSADEAAAAPYRLAVLQRWSGAAMPLPGPLPRPAAAPRPPVAPPDPYVVVITPIAAARLPRVIVPRAIGPTRAMGERIRANNT